MYGLEWQPCYACRVRSRPEEQKTVEAGGLKRVACKDSARCARFIAEAAWAPMKNVLEVINRGLVEKRQGLVQPPPVPQTGAVKRRRAKRSTRSR